MQSYWYPHTRLVYSTYVFAEVGNRQASRRATPLNGRPNDTYADGGRAGTACGWENFAIAPQFPVRTK